MKKIIKFSFIIYLLTTSYCHAYIDPSSASYILTVIIGFFVAGMVTFKSYYYKIKKFFFKKKIEDNSLNKNSKK
jgi:hypothetical protein